MPPDLARLAALADSNYVIGVCTPVELGEGLLTIEATSEDRVGTATLTYSTAELNGNVASCDPDVVAGITLCADGSISCDDESGGGQACINDGDSAYLQQFEWYNDDALWLSISELSCWSSEDPSGCFRDFVGDNLSEPCLSCFADAAVCVNQNCSEDCDSGDGCEACTNLYCRPAFSACSGL